eukprot:7383215-Prymnesium_polylepis.1
MGVPRLTWSPPSVAAASPWAPISAGADGRLLVCRRSPGQQQPISVATSDPPCAPLVSSLCSCVAGCSLVCRVADKAAKRGMNCGSANRARGSTAARASGMRA